MASDEARKIIDALSKEDLRIEVTKGYRSRFQGDNFAYAQARFHQIEEGERAAQHQAELDAATEANEIARSQRSRR